MKTFFSCFLTLTIFCLNLVIAQINETKLVPANGILNDEFGYSVASEGNYVVVGSPNAPYPYNHYGAVYVYEKTAGVWEEKSRLAASDSSASAWFGYSVSITGDFILIGAFRDPENGPQSGAAYIFHKDSTGEWTEQQKLLPADGSAYDEFGTSVSLYGDYAIIGAPFDHVNSVESGSAYIFKRNDTTWVEEAKLLAVNGIGTSPKFGNSVSIYEDYAIIGAYSDEGLGTHPGAAYIFYFNGTNWTQQAKLNASNVNMNHYFGHSVSIYGDYAVVGSSAALTAAGGAAFIFHRNGTSWTEETMIEGSSSFTNSKFGLSVSIDDDYLVVGAPDDDTNGNHAGCAYIFKRDGISWIEQAMVLASDGTEDDWMGFSVFIEGDQILAGAPIQDTGGKYCGAVYVYDGFMTGLSEPNTSNLPVNFSLEQNYPNPFNPTTTIGFRIGQFGLVKLSIHDILGREVATIVNEKLPPGKHEVLWDANDCDSGIYFYQLTAGNFNQTRRMLLIK